MSTALSTAIEQLLQRKADLLREAGEIDAELERAKLALQGAKAFQATPAVRRRRATEHIQIDGSLANEIYAALAAREPRTLDNLARHVNKTHTYVGLACKAMVAAGRLHRMRCMDVNGRPHVYARTAEALTTTPTVASSNGAQSESEEGADAAG